MKKIVNVGRFNVNGGKLMLSDPCYVRSTLLQHVLEGVNDGTWNATVVLSNEGMFGTRVAALAVTHAGHDPNAELVDLVNAGQRVELGVDSGQFGIFNETRYPRCETGDYGDLETFYGRACNATMVYEERAGIIDEGVVSLSGFGDGGYYAKIAKTDGKITSVVVEFIGDETEELCVEPDNAITDDD